MALTLMFLLTCNVFLAFRLVAVEQELAEVKGTVASIGKVSVSAQAQP
ncbi:MAG: hypothetical protein ACRD96_13065 [Bryobacteraceae bacterium]